MLDHDFYDHLDISFSLMTSDWYKSEEEGRFTFTSYPAR